MGTGRCINTWEVVKRHWQLILLVTIIVGGIGYLGKRLWMGLLGAVLGAACGLYIAGKIGVEQKSGE